MAKKLLVCNATYSVPTPSGRHLAPGEIAYVETTPEFETYFIATGIFREVSLPEAVEHLETIETPTEKSKGRSRPPLKET